MSSGSKHLQSAHSEESLPSRGIISQVWETGQARDPETMAEGLEPHVLPRCCPLLFVIQGPLMGSVYPIESDAVLIGRGSHADVIIADESVSREHARLSMSDGIGYVEDLGSQSGTFLNGERIVGRVQVCDGDQLGMGRSTLIKFSLVDRVEQHAMLTLFELTLRDPLTRAYNRRYFERRLLEEFSFARRQGSPLSVLIIDIDHFKLINDQYGHPIGDRVLELVAASIQRTMRPEDVLARYGGEEFIVIARHTSLRNAEVLAERIRRQVAALSVPVAGEVVKATVSIGAATLSVEAPYSSREELVAAVDAAMYSAKSAGRNRVCCAPPIEPFDGEEPS